MFLTPEASYLLKLKPFLKKSNSAVADSNKKEKEKKEK